MEHAQRRIPELLRELEVAPAGAWWRDATARRQRLYGALSRHPDPILREIGQQLADGQMRPADILRNSRYAEALNTAATRAARRLDPVAVAERLEALVAASRSAGGQR